MSEKNFKRWGMGDQMLNMCADAMRGQDNEGQWTAAHGFAGKGDLSAARMLVEVRGDLDATSPGGKTLAHFAATNGDLELMTLLIEQGALVDTGDLAGRSPIWLAAQQGHHDVVVALLAAGADPMERDMEGVRAVEVAEGETAVLLRRHALTDVAGEREPEPDPRRDL